LTTDRLDDRLIRRSLRSCLPPGSCWGRTLRMPRLLTFAAGSPLRQAIRSTARPCSAPSTAAGACSGGSRCAATTTGLRRAARAWRRSGAAAVVRANPFLLLDMLALTTSELSLRTIHNQSSSVLQIPRSWVHSTESQLLGPMAPHQHARAAVPRAGVEIIILKGGNTTLRRCRPGFAKSQPGQYRCVRCTPGSFSSSAGALHCRVCPYGTTSNAGRTGCGACFSRQHTHCSIICMCTVFGCMQLRSVVCGAAATSVKCYCGAFDADSAGFRGHCTCSAAIHANSEASHCAHVSADASTSADACSCADAGASPPAIAESVPFPAAALALASPAATAVPIASASTPPSLAPATLPFSAAPVPKPPSALAAAPLAVAAFTAASLAAASLAAAAFASASRAAPTWHVLNPNAAFLRFCTAALRLLLPPCS